LFESAQRGTVGLQNSEMPTVSEGSESEISMTDIMNVLKRKVCKVPDDWTKAVIVSIYKEKRSQQEFRNFRGISFLRVVGKV
jgi:hypothetical protein